MLKIMRPSIVFKHCLTIGCLTAFISVLFWSCGSKTNIPLNKIVRGDIQVVHNPSGRVPLGAELEFYTKEPCRVILSTDGQSPIIRSFDSFTEEHRLPVIGLYAHVENSVTIELVDEDDNHYRGAIKIQTPPLPDFFPRIEISIIDTTRMEPGDHLIEILIPNKDKFDSYTIVFDNSGDIRWYLDMSETKRLAFSTLRMQNGNSMYVSWIDAYELDDLGRTIQQWQLGSYAGDHDIVELPDGNLLMGASKRESTILINGQSLNTRYDAAVELDRETMNVVKEWDMREVLDVDRSLVNEPIGRDDYFDWFHINSVAYSAPDDCVLISGRNQGVIKVDQNNQLKWILAPHLGWGRGGPMGQGQPTAPFLLTAIDSNGNPFPKQVQDGLALIDEFEWPSGQHSIELLENGNLLLFDNGFARGFERTPAYSRAVEYEINEEERTIRQVWQYGKELGLEFFSAITSDVDVLPNTNNRLITSGYIRLSNDEPHARLIEISYPDNEVIFDAKVYFKNTAPKDVNAWAKFDVLYKAERYYLIPQTN